MEADNLQLYGFSDKALLQELGKYLQNTRLQQNKTQQEIATSAGINRGTLVQLEKGNGGTLLTFIQLMRALDQLQVFDYFISKSTPSPLQLAELAFKKRKRASNKSQKKSSYKSPW